jgi:hypothetical protein
MTITSSKGFSLAETVIALGVLTTGILGAAAVLATGMQNLSSSPGDVVSAQKAAQAVEAVFSARDTGKLTWAQIRNVSNGGVFLDAAQTLKSAGADGIVNTSDDGPVETVRLPGLDGQTNTGDDQIITLNGYTRQITITDVPNENNDLRKVVVTIIFQNGRTTRTYTLTTYISSFA